MCELTEKLRSYNKTSGYSTTMIKAADEIDRLRKKLTIDAISRLLWYVSHDEPGIEWERAEELAENFINSQ